MISLSDCLKPSVSIFLRAFFGLAEVNILGFPYIVLKGLYGKK